jgi:redox-sensitive bicupin YhaK (pirin superfamily)
VVAHNLSTLAAAMSTSAPAALLLPVLKVRPAEITYPTGNKNFAVLQAFPAALTAEEADPFLMCDHFGPTPSDGAAKHADDFPVNWHPHRGMDICTYMTAGVGRHADSLGNRELFETPGLQFCSVGSGIEHAEAGGTPAGGVTEGWQLWVNVPSARKMDAPRYGIAGPELLPVVPLGAGGATARVVSGALDGAAPGPFVTVQPLLILDVALPAGSAEAALTLAPFLDNAIVHVYRGAADVNGVAVDEGGVVLLDARAAGARGVALRARGGAAAAAMVFCGQRLNQPIAWRGPFVMTTAAEINATIAEYQRGAFPPVRVPWDYRRLAAFPAAHPARARA